MGSKAAVADQLLALLIPEAEGERFQAGEERDGSYGVKQRHRLVTCLQVVVGNSGTQVMNMVKADAAGKPLQHAGEFVERAAVERRRGVVPLAVALPVHSLKLVLHVKEPHPRRARHHQHRRLKNDIGLPPKHHA